MGRRAAPLIEEIVSQAMGWVHGFYARRAVESGVAKAAVLIVGSRPVGVNVFYKVNIGITLCTHYYVALREEFRGKGYGMVLVASVEEYCSDADGYVATTGSDNTASIAMFSRLCYKPYRLEEIEERLGYHWANILVRATCGYEDDVFLFKPGDLPSVLSTRTPSMRRGVFDKVCLEPWLELIGAKRL